MSRGWLCYARKCNVFDLSRAKKPSWSCLPIRRLPIRFKLEIVTLFLRISKRTVTFALDKVFQTPSAVLNEEYLLSDIAIVDCIWLYFYLVWYKVCYEISFQYCTLPVIIIIFFRFYTACLAHLNACCIHLNTFSTRKCVTIFAKFEMSREKIYVVRVAFSQSKRIEMGLKGIDMS